MKPTTASEAMLEPFVNDIKSKGYCVEIAAGNEQQHYDGIVGNGSGDDSSNCEGNNRAIIYIASTHESAMQSLSEMKRRVVDFKGKADHRCYVVVDYRCSFRIGDNIFRDWPSALGKEFFQQLKGCGCRVIAYTSSSKDVVMKTYNRLGVEGVKYVNK